MPDSSGPGGALGANRPPAGRMTRAGRSRAPVGVRDFAGRPVAGGLSSGTVAHLGMGFGGPGVAWHRALASYARVSGLGDLTYSTNRSGVFHVARELLGVASPIIIGEAKVAMRPSTNVGDDLEP